MTTESISSRIRQFLGEFVPGREISDQDDLFKAGYITSLMAMQLVLFIEREFALQVGQDDLDLENFRSIASIGRFVARKVSVAE